MNMITRFFRFLRSSALPPPPSDVAQLQPAAVAFHQAGRLDEAEPIYRQILGHDPQNSLALHMLGVIAQQRGNSAEAAELIRQAIVLAPKDPAAYSNLGSVLRSQGQLEAARDALDRALELRPAYPEALNNLGCIFHLEGKQDKAQECFSLAVEADPAYVEALFNMGNIHKERGEVGKAEEYYQSVLVINAEAADAHKSLGNLYQQRGLQGEAETCYRKALVARPDYAEANNDLGTLLASLGRKQEAESCYRQALLAKPDLAEGYNNLGDLLQGQGKLEEAQECLQEALKIRPSFADALSNLGLVLKKQGKIEEAEASIRQALSIQPDHAGARNNLGMLYNDQGRPDDAEACFSKALILSPDSAPIGYNLSTLALLRGDYEKGWALYEKRFQSFDTAQTSSISLHEEFDESPRWRGNPLAGKRILVWTDQGFGDSLMTMRYLPLLPQRGAKRVVVYCEPPLERLASRLPGVDQVVPTSQPAPFGSFDLHCPIMSLPYLFNTRLDSIPSRVPYLSAPALLISQWGKRLEDIRRFKVGLVWAGNKALRDNAKRSIALYQFSPFLDIDNIQLVSLQKGEEAKQLAELGWDVPDWMDNCRDFMDTAALLENLDLVISVDTAVAHLAGALGKPVWLLNRFGSEWRWGLEREDSPWYPSMRIFRQDAPFEWDGVIRHVAGELRNWAALP